VRDPAVLVLDEPCVGLDPVTRARFLEDVSALSEREGGPTTIFVTHHIDEIPSCVTHVLALSDGKVVAVGVVDDVLTDAVMTQTFGAPCRVHRVGGKRVLDVRR
jgi:iron complex transport system ATP-binding protein